MWASPSCPAHVRSGERGAPVLLLIRFVELEEPQGLKARSIALCANHDLGCPISRMFFARCGSAQRFVPRFSRKLVKRRLPNEHCVLPHLAKNTRDMGHPRPVVCAACKAQSHRPASSARLMSAGAATGLLCRPINLLMLFQYLFDLFPGHGEMIFILFQP